MTRSSRPSSEGVRRFLEDLRASAERRTRSDRRLTPTREAPRFYPSERRQQERRASRDRRRVGFEQYGEDDAAFLRELLLNPRLEAACPWCNGNLLVGPPMLREGVAARQVHCTNCRRMVVIDGVPEPLLLHGRDVG